MASPNGCWPMCGTAMTTQQGQKILPPPRQGAENLLDAPERHRNMTDPEFELLLVELRPKLHRYCARMAGSVVDGEDVLQEALVKAVKARPGAGEIAQPERWLFRIAHNAALDYLRRRARADARQSDEDPELMADPNDERPDPEILATSMHTFMRLPRVQRSSVILMDVLGYSLAEIGEIMESSVPAVKSALHRGRTRLHELAQEPDDVAPPQLSPTERTLLASYIERFNARDYDAVRAMLADEVRLDLVNKLQLTGRAQVENYFTNYAKATPRHFELGFVDGRPAALAYEAVAPDEVSYFIVLDWDGSNVVRIRDFLYAPYALDGAAVTVE
jgi:RNA polymerase sigma-70 factor, ECF subfamily